jgi:tetratricopeptide (TPR) repeat protein
MENPTYQAIFERIQAGQFQAALNILAEALENSPRDPYLLYYAGLAHRRLNNYDEAAKYYRKSIEIDPSNPSVHLGLGIAYQLQGLYEKAIESLKEAITLERNFPEAHNSLGLTFSKLGKYRQALECYESAAEAIIDMAFSQLAKEGESYFPSKETTDGKNVRMITPEAFDLIETILKSNLMWAINRNNIGSCLAAIGEKERAKEMFEESIRFIPEGLTYELPSFGLKDLAHE